MATLKQSTIIRVATALENMKHMKPKAGLAGFKYKTAVRVIAPLAKVANESMGELFKAHVVTKSVPHPDKERAEKGETVEQWVKHESGQGFKMRDMDAYRAALAELENAEIEVPEWPPVQFNAMDIEKGQIELEMDDYDRLGELLQMPSVLK